MDPLWKNSGSAHESREEGKDQESVQSSSIPDLGHHIGKWQKHKKYNTQVSQEVSPFPAGDHKAARNRHDSVTRTNMKRIHKRCTTAEWSAKKSLEGLNMFNGTNLTGLRHIDVWFAWKIPYRLIISKYIQIKI